MSSSMLIKELRKMFALMIKGRHSYVSPKETLHFLLDNNLQPMTVGEQKDIFEVFCGFQTQYEKAMKTEEPSPAQSNDIGQKP